MEHPTRQTRSAPMPRADRGSVRVPMLSLGIHDDALPDALFARLWRRIRALGRERFRDSHWVTFWYDLGRPANVVDEAVLHLHDAFAGEVPRRARGVEWWLGRTDLRRVPIEMHVDRDNHLFDETGTLRHPAPLLGAVLQPRSPGRLPPASLISTPARAPAHLVPAEPSDWAVARPHAQSVRELPGQPAPRRVRTPTTRSSRPSALRGPQGRLRLVALVVNCGIAPRSGRAVGWPDLRPPREGVPPLEVRTPGLLQTPWPNLEGCHGPQSRRRRSPQQRRSLLPRRP